jgi:hypothetical protein
MTFIVQSKGAKFSCDTVVAPTGYYRKRDGHIERDGTPSPEMGPIQHAYHFATHRAAAMVGSKLATPIIRETPNIMLDNPTDRPATISHELDGQDGTTNCTTKERP